MATDFNSKELSEIYAEGTPAEELSLRPTILEVLGDVSAKRILDLGCGNGRYSIIFAQRGAEVVGIELSSYQLDIAKKINFHPRISYILQDASDLSQLEDKSFDLVFMNLVVPDIDSPEKLQKLFSEAARVLKKEGRFVFSLMHPLYLSPEQDAWDRAVNFQKENYFKEGYVYNSKAITNKGSSITFNETHFSLDYISKLLQENNFLIKRLAESKPVPEKEMYLPKYLIVECVVNIALVQ